MTDIIKPKARRSDEAAPQAAALEDGEFAINVPSKTIYYRDGGDVVPIANYNDSAIKLGVCTTAAATAAKDVTVDNYTPKPGDLISVTYSLGTTASSVTLNLNDTGAKNVRIANVNASATVHRTAAGGSILYLYDGDFFHLVGSQRSSDADTTNRLSLSAATFVDNVGVTRNKFVMENADGTYTALSVGSTTNDTKIQTSTPLRLGGRILYLNSTGTVAANGTTTAFQIAGVSTQLNYTFNSSGTYVIGQPLYLVGTMNAQGFFVLDQTDLTSWYTQTLPTTDDGKIYIRLGMVDGANALSLHPEQLAFWYQGGRVRLYPDRDDTAKLDAVSFMGLGGSANRDRIIRYPKDGSAYYGSVAEGAVKIKLPGDFLSNTMIRFTVDLRNYRSNGMATRLLIGGYMYASGGGTWTRTSSTILTSEVNTADLKVRFGSEDGRPVVYIGELTSTVNYTSAVVSDVHVTKISNGNPEIYDQGWEVGLETVAFGDQPNGAAPQEALGRLGATHLLTPRTINGVSFSGESNITINAANPSALTIGNGLTGSNYTGSAAVTVVLGTPSDITLASTNNVSATSHSHAFNPGGTAAQYIRGNGTLAPFPSVISTDTQIHAGDGLSGGGSLSEDRTISLATPGTLSGSTSNAVTSTGHTHALSANLSAWDGVHPNNFVTQYPIAPAMSEVSQDFIAPNIVENPDSNIAIGNGASSTYGFGLIAIGEGSQAGGGNHGVAIGREAIAGTQSVAIGGLASAESFISVAIGNGSSATTGGVAIGPSAEVRNIPTASNGVAIGAMSRTSRGDEVAFANLDVFTSLSTSPRILAGVANPEVGQDAVNLQTLETKIADSRRMEGRYISSGLFDTLTSADLNAIVELSGNVDIAITLPAGLGQHRDAITFVNSSLGGTITVAKANGVSIYRDGADDDLTVEAGSMVTIIRSFHDDRWIA